MGYNDELMHYGVLGMKWGHHKALKKSSSYQSAKKAYKSAKKQYNKDFNAAYKDRKNTTKVDKMQDSAKKLNKAKSNLKTTKKRVTKKFDDKHPMLKTAATRSAKAKSLNRKKLALDLGAYFVDSQLRKNKATLNGKPMRVSTDFQAVGKAYLNYKYSKDFFKD